jgi:hypothetical protein
MALKDENGFYKPVKTEISDAEKLPTAAEQRPEEATRDFSQNREEAGKHRHRKAIGAEEVRRARQTMKDYFNAKRLFDIRYRENFDMYNLLYNERAEMRFVKDGDGVLHRDLIQTKMGAQTLNVILNKHADAMDNYPQPVFLPRSRDDEETAQMLNSIVPCILERNKYEKTYSDAWTDKLVGGADGIAVLWDPQKDNGLGDIAISRMNLLCVAWAPFVEDIQESPHLFVVDYRDVEEVKDAYPVLKEVSTEDLGLEKMTTYHADDETRNKAAVIDWYYKKDGVLHFCKFVGSEVIFASENEPQKFPNGYYAHGMYPFVITPLFPLRRTPVGFSFADICRPMQLQLDELKRDVLKNIKVNSQTRNLVSNGAGVNMKDLADTNKEFVEVQFQGDLSRLMYPMDTKDIAPGALSMYQAGVDEIKDVTGTNDPANGAGAAGVTSGSAIAALQEAGGKISRDINKGGFREFEQICFLILELIRQFYNPARWFRIVGEDKKTEYVEFDNEGLLPQTVTVDGVDGTFERLPVFDIQVKAQRSNPFTTAANNQMMVDMFNMGAFAPQNAEAALAMLECMSFEGKDKLVDIIKKNAQMAQEMQNMAQQLQMTQAMLAQQAADGMTALPPAENVNLQTESEGLTI